MQVLNATTQTVRAYADAYASLLEAQLALTGAVLTPDQRDRNAGPDADEASDAKRWSAAAELPKMPKPGASWYRPPYENPALAFWDEMLRPWRTFVPAAWPATTPFATANPFASAPHLSMFSAWFDLWSQALTTMSGGAPGMPGSAAQSSPFPGVALARVIFPDDTEVTITIPCMPPFFGLPGWPPRT